MSLKIKKEAGNEKEEEKNTVFERSQTLVGNLELEGSDKRSGIVKDCYVGDVNGTHCFKSEEKTMAEKREGRLRNERDCTEI